MKMDLWIDVRAASANRMQSAALVRIWTGEQMRFHFPGIWGLAELFARTLSFDPNAHPCVAARAPIVRKVLLE
jgi:hypothetical protein